MPFWGCSAGSFHSFDWFWKERSCKIVHGSLGVMRKCALAHWSVADFKKKKRKMAGKRVAQNGGAAKVACVSCRLSSSFYPLLLLVSLQEWIHGLFMILGPFLLLKEQSFKKRKTLLLLTPSAGMHWNDRHRNARSWKGIESECMKRRGGFNYRNT